MGRFGEVLKRAGENSLRSGYANSLGAIRGGGGFLGMGFFAFAVERSYAAEHDGLSYTIS